MGIKIKHKDPTLNEFSTDDVVINVQSGSLFFKSNTKLFKLQGDDQSTTDISDSLIITGLINSRGPKYTVELDGNNNNGPRINMGTSPFNTSVPNDSDLFMSFGAYGYINNLDTKDRDFHLYGTNTTTGFYFDESAGNFGIGITSPHQQLHIKENMMMGDNAGGGNFIHGRDNLALSADGVVSIIADANDTSGTGTSDLYLGYGSAIDLNTSPSETFANTFPNNKPRVALIRLDSSANRIAMGAGVGSMTPGAILHITGSDANLLKIERSDANNVNVAYTNTTGTMYAGIDTISSALIWGVGYNQDMSAGGVLIVSGSRVGIGTKAPSAPLHIHQSGTDDGTAVEILRLSRLSSTDHGSSTPVSEAYIGLHTDDSGTGQLEMARISWAADNAANAEDDGRLDFYTRQENAITRAMTLDCEGHFGIGQSDPQYRLSVRNDATSTIGHFRSDYTGQNRIRVERGSNTYTDLSAGSPAYGGGVQTSHELRLCVNGESITTSSLLIETDRRVGIGIYQGNYTLPAVADDDSRLYVQRAADATTTGFTCVASFKNPTNAASNQGVTAGIKLKLGSTSEHAKWAGIACQSAANYSNTTELTFWPNDTAGEKAVLTSGGNWNIAGSVNPGSDLKLKKNINNIESSLETIKSLRGVTFDWKDEKKDNGKLQHGFIAQEVEKILPNLITKGNNFKHMNYSGIIPVLVEALKDQQKQIDELKKQING